MEDRVKDIIKSIKSKAVVAGQSAQRTAEKAGRLAGEIVDQTKLNFRIGELENELSDKFVEMGKIVYEANSNPDADTGRLQDIIAEADAISDAIAEARAKLEESRRTKKCPNPDCGNICSKEDRFCPKCGAVLD